MLLFSIQKAFKGLFSKPAPQVEPKPAPTLCTVHFTYDTKGIYGAGKNKKDSVFAWVEPDATERDCLKLFSPPGVDITNCVVTRVIVVPVSTVKHFDK